MTPNLTDLLLKRQEILDSQLGATSVFEQPTAKGDVSELNWEEVLGEFLPNRYTTSRGAFAIDTNGDVSQEIDLAIHDAHFCPLLFEEADRCYIPAESIYAVFEIKPEINKNRIEYAADKAKLVRSLYRTSVPIVHAGGEHEPREPFRILAGILAARSDWNPPFGDSLIAVLSGLDELQQLDLGYAVEHGAFEASYGKSEATTLEVSDPGAGLMYFLVRLFTRLQGMGSVTAVDLAAYGRDLEQS